MRGVGMTGDGRPLGARPHERNGVRGSCSSGVRSRSAVPESAETARDGVAAKDSECVDKDRSGVDCTGVSGGSTAPSLGEKTEAGVCVLADSGVAEEPGDGGTVTAAAASTVAVPESLVFSLPTAGGLIGSVGEAPGAGGAATGAGGGNGDVDGGGGAAGSVPGAG